MKENDKKNQILTLPQYGIFAQGTHAHYFLEFDLKPGVTSQQAISSIRKLRIPDVSAGGVNFVIAFGNRVWREAAPHLSPVSLADFHEIEGSMGHRVPAAQHDLWLWISASTPDVVWDHARFAAGAISDVTTLKVEQAGFTYRDSRDITGFIDGTANPPVRLAAEVALVPPGEPGEGGSCILAMRWVHNLESFNQLSVAEQEKVIGRTKADSVELSDSSKPVTAHIARMTIEEGGQELQIYRRSVPFGSVGEHGLYFLAFSADPSRYDRMLARMFGNSGDGIQDRLITFSRALSGAYYFAPSVNALNELVGTEED
jgi:putative iron-dependent peroxidase